MSKPKFSFFHAHNATRPISAAGELISFFPYENAGSWLGVYATSNEKISAALKELAADKKSSVTEISRDEFVKAIQLKKKNAGSFSESIAASFIGLSDELLAEFAGEVGAPVNPEPEPEAQVSESAPVESVEEALKTGSVDQSPAPTLPPAAE